LYGQPHHPYLPSFPTRRSSDLLLGGLHSEQATNGGGLEINFAPDRRVYDGRFSNNAWLQELPDPLTKLTWDNAALVSGSGSSWRDRKSTRLNSSHSQISYAVFC